MLSAAPRTSAPSRHGNTTTRCTSPPPGGLRLAEVIAIVQVWRMVKKFDVAVLAATSSTAATTGT